MRYTQLKLSVLSLFTLAACELSQPPAKVEYRLENYYGYGDIKEKKPATTTAAKASAYTPPSEVIIEDTPSLSDTAYTVPQSEQLVYTDVSTKPRTVNISETVHTVGRGETLYSISRQYDVPIMPIIVINGLEPPYALKTGQQVRIPEGKFHTVTHGETLYSVSRQYGVDMSGIVKLNQLEQPYNIVQGQKLQIPFPSDMPSDSGVNKTVVADGATYEYTSPDDAGKPVSMRRPSGGLLGGGFRQEPEVVTTPQPIDTEVETAKLATKPAESAPAPVVLTSNEVVKQDGKFMWPVQGSVVKKFGQQGSEYNDGINISASSGTAVKASNAGRVVYTGNSLKSYGNLVIIKHDNGLLSAYAHMNDVSVKKDQKISKGQTIGTVGSTGKVTSPQLYFAIRKGKDAKNPMNYLK